MQEIPPLRPLIITVKEARKLLGAEANRLTDEQVEGYIRAFMDISIHGLQIIAGKNTMVVDYE